MKGNSIVRDDTRGARSGAECPAEMHSGRKVTAVQLSTVRVCHFAYVISHDPRSVKWVLLPRPFLEKGLRSSVRPEAPLCRCAFEILPCL